MLTVVKRCFNNMEENLLEYLPESVKVVNVTDIKNVYKPRKNTGAKLASNDPNALLEKPIQPLFIIDLIKTQNDEDFLYSVQPMNYIKMIINIFEKGKLHISLIN